MKPTFLSQERPRSRPLRFLIFLRNGALVLLVLGFIAGTALFAPHGLRLPIIVYGLALIVLAAVLYQLRRITNSLRDTQAQAQAILDMAADGILTADEAGRVVSFNAAAGRLFGRAPDEVLGQHISLLIPKLQDGLMMPTVSQWGEPSIGGRREIEGKRGNGMFPLDLSVSAGEIAGRRTYTVVVRDLTEQRRVEEALDRERTLLARLMDHIPDHIYFKDEQSRFLRINRALAGRFGLSNPADANGRTDFDYFTVEHAGAAFHDEQEVMRTGEPIIGVEEKETWPDGRATWVSTTKLPLRDKHGKVVGTFGLSRDITAKKLAEVELQKAKELAEANAAWTRLVVDTAYDAFVVMDEEGRITDWNRQAEAIFGWPRVEAIGRMLAETIIPADFRDRHTRGLSRFLATGEGPVVNQRLELPAMDRNGRLFPVEITIRAIRQGQQHVFSAFLHDISARKLAEKELQKAKESAEQANRAKSEFLANMSHEIRTPMNGILGMTELALGTALTPEQREYLQMVKSSAEALLTILNDILDFSKIEARKLQLEPVTFNLRDAVGDTVRALAVRAQQKGLELVCDVRSDVPEHVVGDPGRLRQVLVNLLGNAIKFTQQGEVVVLVEMHQAERRTQNDRKEDSNPAASAVVLHSAFCTLHFEVRDTGIGIPPEKLDAIFQPFEQADHSTTRRYGGTGLGLAIASQLVELMGGRFDVSSVVGKGSSFSFNAQLGVPVDVPVTTPGRTVHLVGHRVLAVDDNATNRRIFADMLRNWGMRATVCESAPEALAELLRGAEVGDPYGLLLLDVNMPDVDGFMLAAQVQATPALTGTVLVMLTSAGRPDDIARCRALGIDTYLLKPVKQSDLLAALLNAMDGSRRQAPPRQQDPVSRRRSLQVLLAEDNVVNQKLAARLLEKQGHQVTVVDNGRAAVEAMRCGTFDVVLMDVQMPELDGFEATAAIRAMEKSGERLPIIAMTAHAMKGDRERCLAAGMDGYLSKPIQAREMIEVIERLALRKEE